MIYQLVRRDFSWKAAAFLAALCPVAGLTGYWSPSRFLAFWFFVCLTFLWATVSRRCTLFEAALPIRGRDILVARLLLGEILIWMPIFSAVLTMAALGVASWWTGALFKLGALLMLAAIAIQSFRIEEFSIPVPRVWPVIALGSFVVAFLVVNSAPTPLVLIICGLGSVALFRKSWIAVPESFQVASVKEVRPGIGTTKSWLPSPVWGPYLRTLFTRKSIPIYFCLVIFVLTGPASPLFATASIYVFIALANEMTSLQWMYSLPISRLKLFLLLPSVSLFLAANLVALWFSQLRARDAVIVFLSQAVLAFLGLLSQELPLMHLPIVPRKYRVWAPGFMVLIAAGYLLWHWADRRPITNFLVFELSRILPANLVQATAISAALLGAMYWIAYAGFRRMEIQKSIRLNHFRESA